jgi:hypothetical protein
MHKLGSLHLRLSVLYVLIGMGWGLHMAISGDHSSFPAHAHLNLVGYVSVFLYGLFYRSLPALPAGRLEWSQFALAHLGVVLMVPGVALAHGENVAVGEPLAAVGSLITFAAMILFALIVYRRTAAVA